MNTELSRAGEASLADPRIFAVVVNWNRPQDTLKCLDSLTRQQGVRARLVVVDNGSSDDSVARIQASFPQATLIASPENLRFAGGTNLGVRAALEAGADYVLLINNDAFLHPEALATLLRYARQEEVGLVAPLIYWADPPDRIWSVGGRLRPLVMEVSHEWEGQPDPRRWPEILERDFVTGCCLLVPRRTFERVGLLDEQFHMYYDDFDFSCRVRAAGLRILVIPAARAWHNVAASSGGRDTPNERYWMARSSVVFFRKHIHGWRWPVVIAWRLGSAVRTTMRLLVRRQLAAISAYWRGIGDGLRAPLADRGR